MRLKLALKTLDRVQRVVSDNGRAEMVLQIFSNDVAEAIAHLTPAIGSGSPNLVLEARKGKFYFDSSSAPGSRLYFKAVDEIAANKADGWELV